MRACDCGACARSEACAGPLCMRFCTSAALLPPAPLAAAAAAPHDTLRHSAARAAAAHRSLHEEGLPPHERADCSGLTAQRHAVPFAPRVRRALRVARSGQAGGGACRRKRPKSLPGSTGMLGGCLTLSIMSSAPQLRASAAQRSAALPMRQNADEVARRCGPVVGWSGGGRRSGGLGRPQRRGRKDRMQEWSGSEGSVAAIGASGNGRLADASESPA